MSKAGLLGMVNAAGTTPRRTSLTGLNIPAYDGGIITTLSPVQANVAGTVLFLNGMEQTYGVVWTVADDGVVSWIAGGTVSISPEDRVTILWQSN